MGNSTGKSKGVANHEKSPIPGLKVDPIDNEELVALKQVCLSYIAQIEWEIDSIPPKKENEPEPDFEPIFLRLKDYVTRAKRQLGRQEIIETKHKILVLPDLPTEEPPTPASSGDFPGIYNIYLECKDTFI